MSDLAARWRALRAETPHVRIRDAAATLGVSEAELLATQLGEGVSRLDGDMHALLHALPAVGRCMALTRNEHAVSEVRGQYGGVELDTHVGQVVGDAIDLRVFLDHWRHAFAVAEPRRSVHVFDASGTAVHKVYLEPEGDAAAWDAFVAAHLAPQAPPLAVTPPAAPRPDKPDSDVDLATFLTGWDAMQDTHEFFHLLRKHGVGRVQALRLAGPSRARSSGPDALGRVLDASAAAATRIMIFVGNRGCLQVFSGTIGRTVRKGPWINVMDPGFNLHLREDQIASSWVVRKPTRSGVVTSLELFDARGETIAMVFRKREDRALAEDPAWAQLVDEAAA